MAAAAAILAGAILVLTDELHPALVNQPSPSAAPATHPDVGDVLAADRVGAPRGRVSCAHHGEITPKGTDGQYIDLMAGRRGIEPRLARLERAVLPMNDQPVWTILALTIADSSAGKVFCRVFEHISTVTGGCAVVGLFVTGGVYAVYPLLLEHTCPSLYFCFVQRCTVFPPSR